MDPIMYWNDVALEANRVSHTIPEDPKLREQTGPTLSARALAIVHLAMYEAFAGASDFPADLPEYLGVPAPPGAPLADQPKAAAVAAAAHATLSSLFPLQKPFFDLKHAQAGLAGAGLKEGHEFGLLVAQRILDDRKGDPGAGDNGHATSMARGAHRPDPDNPGQGYHAPFYGARSKLFATPHRHTLDDPPRPTLPTSPAAYINALRQVRRRGIAPELMGTLPAGAARRSVEETLVGVYWAYDGALELGTPPRLYNKIVRVVADSQGNTPAENARLFALINVAMADAGILAWDDKFRHDLWRPVVGIREHDRSMGPAGVANNTISPESQPDWLPLGAPNTNSRTSNKEAPPKNGTPPFPAYPSGHATFGAAAFHITRLFYGPDPGGVDRGGVSDGDRAPDTLFDHLEFVSDEHNGVSRDSKGMVRPRHVRNFPDGLWGMIIENGRSRVWLGVHWVFDAFAVVDPNNPDSDPDLTQNVGGVRLGLDIAEDIFSDGMKHASAAGPRI
jgi:hypothetical protein